ncbi:sigma-54 interaction domain-containing protein [Candidatus Uabimicrobium sp. HlEnr_7]|uniref:sigma-54 interaction domain-containing protein n=1 Tax=Candidatus Uabimicrobium helgolandensis TaxID=3095367 RepID=UPI00355683DB
MDITKLQYLADLSVLISDNDDLFERTKAAAVFLQEFDDKYFIAITGQAPTTEILYKNGNKKFAIDWFKENNTPLHCYSAKKYGFCIEAKQVIYIESKRKFSPNEISIFTIVHNLLRIRNKQNTTTKTTKKKRIQQRGKLKFPYVEIIGESKTLIAQLARLDKVIPSNVPILIQGESGTGKELIARAIHMYGLRNKQPFVGENCAALAETLLESELFGHVKGAFTGAVQSRKGLFEHADKGTIFLDEIGDMSINMQKKLLRTLQNGEIRQVGGKSIKNVDVRIVAATNKDLQYEVQQGNFREDLFYRLNVVTIQLPALRERENDILLLFDFFYKKVCKEMGVEEKPVDAEVKDMFLQYKWPGNIRELQNEIRRIVALCDDVVNVDIVSENVKNNKI